jgi:hypothetical protein
MRGCGTQRVVWRLLRPRPSGVSGGQSRRRTVHRGLNPTLGIGGSLEKVAPAIETNPQCTRYDGGTLWSQRPRRDRM